MVRVVANVLMLSVRVCKESGAFLERTVKSQGPGFGDSASRLWGPIFQIYIWIGQITGGSGEGPGNAREGECGNCSGTTGE